VNTVLPGPSRSEGVETFVQQIADQQGMTFGEMEREFFNNIRPSSLIQRFATPEEDANMIVYLCGVGAAATNGAALRVDGGVVRAAL
jgi:NAD(P)-dependent dehydrogenase (short-subunit alcohol dehydrogenase family)